VTEYLRSEEDRKNAILNDVPGTKFYFESQKFSDIPGYYNLPVQNRTQLNSVGAHEVRKYNNLIDAAAARYSIDPDIVKAIIYTEESRGAIYGKPAEWLGMAHTFYPGNINTSWQKLIPGSDVHNPKDNIELTAKLISQIAKRLDDPSIENIYSLYNSLSHDRTYVNKETKTTPYFAKMAMEAKAWEKDDWSAPDFPKDASLKNLSPDRQGFPGDRYGNWASAPIGMSPPTPPDYPESLDNRFGSWGSAPAGGSGDTNSPLLRALEKYRRSAAPDGPSSVAAAPSLVPSNVSVPGFDSQSADELYAARNRAARMLGGARSYIENSLIPSAQAASSSPPLYGSPTTDADGSPPPVPVRRLVGRIVDDPRTPAFDSGAPAAPSPSNGFPVPDRGDSFGDRFGNWASTGAGDTPRQPQESAPSYSEMLHQYLNQPTAGQSQAPEPAPGINLPNPYQSVPPIAAPPDYPATTGNGSIEKWIASLAGANPDDPTQFQVPPIFSPLYRR
jgi:hypothetical protein